jgi:hypothetical protein
MSHKIVIYFLADILYIGAQEAHGHKNEKEQRSKSVN